VARHLRGKKKKDFPHARRQKVCGLFLEGENEARGGTEFDPDLGRDCQQRGEETMIICSPIHGNDFLGGRKEKLSERRC